MDYSRYTYIDSDAAAATIDPPKEQHIPLLSGSKTSHGLDETKLTTAQPGGKDVADAGIKPKPLHPFASALTMNNEPTSIPLLPITKIKKEGRDQMEGAPDVTIKLEGELEREARKRNISNVPATVGADVMDDGTKSEIPEIRGALFQTKKTVAQGLLDIALLTANASQMKNLMETENHPNYTACLVLLGISISLQILVALLLLIVGRMDYEQSSKQRKKDNKWIVIWNDISTAGVFLITVVNIFIASFISHGKAYVPEVNAAAAWREKMQLERLQHNQHYELFSPKVTNVSNAGLSLT